MAVYNKFNIFTKDLIDAKHNFGSHTFKVMLTNTAPVSTNVDKSNITEISSGGTTGYTAGGNSVTITESTASGVAKVVGANTTFTASTGGIGPFQYAVFYNANASPYPLISWWDYGSPITLASTETLTVSFDATNGIFQVS